MFKIGHFTKSALQAALCCLITNLSIRARQPQDICLSGRHDACVAWLSVSVPGHASVTSPVMSWPLTHYRDMFWCHQARPSPNVQWSQPNTIGVWIINKSSLWLCVSLCIILQRNGPKCQCNIITQWVLLSELVLCLWFYIYPFDTDTSLLWVSSFWTWPIVTTAVSMVL